MRANMEYIIPPTQPQPYAMATVKSSFFHRGQLYGSLGDSEGCGTKTVLPDGSCLSKFESTPAETSRSTRPSVLRGDVPGTCSKCLSSRIPRGILFHGSGLGWATSIHGLRMELLCSRPSNHNPGGYRPGLLR